ncbi:MAG: NusG domain II-containing protein [Spirochaetia bacterium]|nr:NusG domain II-containing protein [Spirochaetia bacterium]
MKHIKLVDILFFTLFLTISVLSISLFTTISTNPEVHVTSGGKEWVYDLSVDTKASFEGPVGLTTIEIFDNKVHVHESDCKNQVCVLAGWISKPGEWIACLPNNVFIVIQGEQEIAKEGEVDETSF